MVETIRKLASVRVRVELRIADDVIVGDHRSTGSAAIVAAEDAVERGVLVVRVDAEAFTASIQVPGLSVHTVSEDDVRDLREPVVGRVATGCWRLETVVDRAGTQAGS